MITIHFKTKLLFEANFDFSDSSPECVQWYWCAQEQMKLKVSLMRDIFSINECIQSKS